VIIARVREIGGILVLGGVRDIALAIAIATEGILVRGSGVRGVVRLRGGVGERSSIAVRGLSLGLGAVWVVLRVT